MAKIQVLSDVLASQVAAGEVVERPASVVKELVENSMDAGATHIEVEILKGGKSLLKVSDDGVGMQREDALMCLERHATSKLHSLGQLAAISTMGFRGEALPSIASVSRFRLATREANALEGSEVIVSGGVVKSVGSAGMAAGTVMEVRDLFFNVPARRKFMRADTTESAHIEHQIRLHALATPHIRYTFRKDKRVVFDLAASADQRVRIAALAGKEAARELQEVPRYEYGGMSVFGYMLPSDYARKGRKQQFVFLNGRPIEDSTISRAIRDGYKGSLADALNPAVWLWLEMEPELVDVNVHPAKKEVRFHKPIEVRTLVVDAVLAGFEKAYENTRLRGTPKIVSKLSGTESAVSMPVTSGSKVIYDEESCRGDDVVAEGSAKYAADLNQARSDRLTNDQVDLVKQSGRREPGKAEVIASDKSEMSAEDKNPQSIQRPLLSSQPSLPVADTAEGMPQEAQPRLTVLCPLHQRYVLLEGEEGLVMLDPRAAKERIHYEAFLRGVECVEMESQGLLVPEVVELDARDLDTVLRHIDHFIQAGIEIEPFGGRSIQIRSLPALLSEKDPRVFLQEVVDELHATHGAKKSRSMAYELFAQTLSRQATRADPFQFSQADAILSALFECDLPYCTPDGSPTLIQISLKEIQRKFLSS